MNEEEILRRLVRASGGDAPPEIDVSNRVLADLSRRRRPDTLPFYFAGVSAAAAAALAIAAGRVLLAPVEPFGDLFNSMIAVMP